MHGREGKRAQQSGTHKRFSAHAPPSRLQSRSPSCTTPELAWFGVSLEMLLAAYITIPSPNIAIYISCGFELANQIANAIAVDGSHESSISSQVPHSSRKLIEVLSRSDVDSWGTRPHSADIPIVYPIPVFGSSTPPTPASVRALPVSLPAYSGT